MYYSAIFFVIILIILWYLNCRKPRNFPPGPKWLPIIGSAFTINHYRKKTGLLCKAFTYIAEQYKDNRGVVGFKNGKDKLVVAFTNDSIKEMMLNEDFDGRPVGLFFETRTWGLRRGIMFTDGEFWRDQKRFLVRHLKDFGFSKRGMNSLIESQSEMVVTDMKKLVGAGKLISMQNYFASYVLNTLWSMMAGVTYTADNNEYKELQDLIQELFLNIDMTGSKFSRFPLLRFIAPEYSGFKQFIDIHKSIFSFIGREIKKHKETYKSVDEPQDLIDVYLKALESPDKKSSFTEKQLVAICLDMFLAGSETTTKTLEFAFLYLVRDVEIQSKAQLEIDTVVGRDRLPCVEDKPKFVLLYFSNENFYSFLYHCLFQLTIL